MTVDKRGETEMKSRTTGLLLALTILLSPLAGARGQNVMLASEEAQIKQYREEIRALSAKSPPPEAQEAYRRSLLSLRKELYKRLLKKSGALEKDIHDLQSPNASAELQNYVKQLESTLQGLNREIEVLERDLDQSLNVAAADAAPPPPAPTPAASPASTPSAEQQSFDAAVSAIKALPADAAKEAVAPREVAASELPPASCNDKGVPLPSTDPKAKGPSQFDRNVCRLAKKVVSGDPKEILISRDELDLFPILIAKLLKTRGDTSYVAFVTEAQEARTDQQVGAGPNSAGTTSLVSKGGVPYALGFAVENGAATETVSDTTVTFRINPVGTLNLFANKGFITGFKQSERDPLLKLLRKTSVGLTFDTSRGDQPGVFTGKRQQLSAVSARFEFVNERDPRLPKYERKWEEFVATEGVALARQIWATTLATTDFKGNSPIKFTDTSLQAWLEQTSERLSKIDQGLSEEAKVNEAARIIREQADLLPVNRISDATVGAINNFARQFVAYSKKKRDIINEINRANVFTFEYTNKREVNAPDTSNFRFIAAKGKKVGDGRMDFTANGSFTFFHSRPAPATPNGPKPGRVRDFQFAGQVDVPFKLGDVGQFVFWFSGRYERLMENASTQVGTTVPGTKGDIAVGQFGLRVPIPGMGMHLPISFTIANRTELVKEKEVRGNFGFTFNLDSILARFKPF
jgi:hypothetical protein